MRFCVGTTTERFKNTMIVRNESLFKKESAKENGSVNATKLSEEWMPIWLRGTLNVKDSNRDVTLSLRQSGVRDLVAE